MKTMRYEAEILRRLEREGAIATRRWLDTEEGLVFRCGCMEFNPKLCWPELQRLYAIRKRENAESWDIALSMADQEVRDIESKNGENFTYQERESLARGIAEVLMIDTGFAPPHWTSVTRCFSCGHMPAPPGEVRCRWCATTIGQILADCGEMVEQ